MFEYVCDTCGLHFISLIGWISHLKENPGHKEKKE